MNGTAGTVLNQSLRLPAQGAVNTWNAAIRYRLLGDLGEQVAMGCPQWLFYRDRACGRNPGCMSSMSACA
ncbi:hypothetical protein WJ971_28230 [Achromobacter xylosoxidans]